MDLLWLLRETACGGGRRKQDWEGKRTVMMKTANPAVQSSSLCSGRPLTRVRNNGISVVGRTVCIKEEWVLQGEASGPERKVRDLHLFLLLP